MTDTTPYKIMVVGSRAVLNIIDMFDNSSPAQILNIVEKWALAFDPTAVVRTRVEHHGYDGAFDVVEEILRLESDEEFEKRMTILHGKKKSREKRIKKLEEELKVLKSLEL